MVISNYNIVCCCDYLWILCVYHIVLRQAFIYICIILEKYYFHHHHKASTPNHHCHITMWCMHNAVHMPSQGFFYYLFITYKHKLIWYPIKAKPHTLSCWIFENIAPDWAYIQCKAGGKLALLSALSDHPLALLVILLVLSRRRMEYVEPYFIITK